MEPSDDDLDQLWHLRSRSFGSIAEQYDRFRPGYPEAVIRDVLARAPGRNVLEAGAGTGIATAALASLGASVTATEHDSEMAAIAIQRTRGLDVEVIVTKFEDYDAAPQSFDLVVAAQSWHWIDAIEGPEVARQALRPGGLLCIVWNRPREFSGPIWAEIQRAYARFAPELDRQSAIQTRRYDAPEPERYHGFSPWQLQTYEWDQPFDSTSYTGFIATHSDHVLLDDDTRNRLLEAIDAAISAGGGSLTYRWRTLLYTAERL